VLLTRGPPWKRVYSGQGKVWLCGHDLTSRGQRVEASQLLRDNQKICESVGGP
jgi:hypothetical protein